MTVFLPCLFESRSQHTGTVPLTSKVAMCENILDEAVLPPATEKVGYNDEHASGHDCLARFRDKHAYSLSPYRCEPDFFRPRLRFGDGTNF